MKKVIFVFCKRNFQSTFLSEKEQQHAIHGIDYTSGKFYTINDKKDTQNPDIVFVPEIDLGQAELSLLASCCSRKKKVYSIFDQEAQFEKHTIATHLWELAEGKLMLPIHAAHFSSRNETVNVLLQLIEYTYNAQEEAYYTTYRRLIKTFKFDINLEASFFIMDRHSSNEPKLNQTPYSNKHPLGQEINKLLAKPDVKKMLQNTSGDDPKTHRIIRLQKLQSSLFKISH